MAAIYDQQIIQLLSVVGEKGISVSAITKHVYNQNCTFFNQVDLQEVKSYVQQFLLRNSKSPQSLIENTGKRGCYRLNTSRSIQAMQLMLDFESADKNKTEQPQEPYRQDWSLSLFGDEI